MTLRDHLAEPLVVGEPDVVGPLAVYPVFGPACEQGFVALSQANGDVVIGELESSSVRDLVVTNRGKMPVLLYEGEEVLGGQQNRSLDASVLVGNDAKVTLPVSCVEAGRWDHASHRARFHSSPHYPSPELRRAKAKSSRERATAGAEARPDQAETWRLVDSISARVGSSSPTRAFSDAYDERRRDLRKIEREVKLRDGQLGTLVTLGQEFCVLDVVGRPDVFAALHEPLVRGYALEVLAAAGTGEAVPSTATAREVVAAVLGAAGDRHPSVGLGADVRFGRRGVAGSALVHQCELVALTAFPDRGDGSGTGRSRRESGRIVRPSARGRHPAP